MLYIIIFFPYTKSYVKGKTYFMLIYPVFILKIQIKTIQSLSSKANKDNSIKKNDKKKRDVFKNCKKEKVIKLIL